MIYLFDSELPASYKFVSGCSHYSQLWAKCITSNFKILERNQELECFENFKYDYPECLIIDSKYYIDQKGLEEIKKRVRLGAINLVVKDGDKIVLCYFKSNSCLYREFQRDTLGYLQRFDENFVRSHFSSIRSRSSNQVSTNSDIVIKRSSFVDKMQSEFRFMSKGAAEYGFYTAVDDFKIIDGVAEYKMPRVAPGDVSAFYLDDRHEFFDVSNFKGFCVDYFAGSAASPIKGVSLFKEKMLHQMNDRCLHVQNIFTIDDQIDEGLKQNLLRLLVSLSEQFTLMFNRGVFNFLDDSPSGFFHGDFCLSNILFCDISQSFYLIDPKGDIALPAIYDLAKLSHSMCGMYDVLLEGDFRISLTSRGIQLDLPSKSDNFIGLFKSILDEVGYHSFREVRLFEAYLFLTMLKFHVDDPRRCLAFLLQSKNILDLNI